MRHWQLSIAERVASLQLWIPPLLVDRVIFPSAQVISSLTMIYNISVGLDSCGILPSILALPPDETGCILPFPEQFLLTLFSWSFIRSVHEPHTLHSELIVPFQELTKKHGILLSPHLPPTFQMGSNVVWNSMAFLA